MQDATCQQSLDAVRVSHSEQSDPTLLTVAVAGIEPDAVIEQVGHRLLLVAATSGLLPCAARPFIG